MYTPLKNEFERSSKILGLFVSPISQMVAAKEENLQNSSEVRNLDFLDTHNNNSIFTHYQQLSIMISVLIFRATQCHMH